MHVFFKLLAILNFLSFAEHTLATTQFLKSVDSRDVVENFNYVFEFENRKAF